MSELKTKIGLEIHVQLKTKSKMFCRCDNDSSGKKPNTTVCPVCLGLPGTLPVANRQAIEWTFKTGLALGCKIAETAKFDRKHYFYPDLPKGYQISQYDEPFCIGGGVEIDGVSVRLNRIHLEEDAGKLIHSGGKSLVDLNRAGTPLMEIVTEPDITSPSQAADFLRKLQKIVRDVVEVSDANMEKGHMRCDANISVSSEDNMSPIIEIKNLNSFKFVEKALLLVESELKEKSSDWPEKRTKETWGYDSVKNAVFVQRRKEEASDYRYFPDPDLPPVKLAEFDLEKLKNNINSGEEQIVADLVSDGVNESEAKILAANKISISFYWAVAHELVAVEAKSLLAKAIVHKYFSFQVDPSDNEKAPTYSWLITCLLDGQITKAKFGAIANNIHAGATLDEAKSQIGGKIASNSLEQIIEGVIAANPAEVERYKNGDKKLFGFFMGLAMRETKGSANPQEIDKILKEKI